MRNALESGATYRGEPMDAGADALGELRRSDGIARDPGAQRQRLAEDGYLLLPGQLRREEVLEARREVLRRLALRGVVDDTGHPLLDGVVLPGVNLGSTHDLARENAPLDRVLYAGPMIAFYEGLLGGPVRHFDYTWFRAKMPGPGTVTQPHYDVVFMGRGTKNLWTSWTPLGDVPYEHGGLLVLEGSHRLEEVRRTYGAADVDKYCDNKGGAGPIVRSAQAEGRELTAEEHGQIQWEGRGHYSPDAIATRRELGGRWLTADYRAGDLLVLSMYTMHASSDNRSDRIRLSADSRYQPASEPVDERWIGDDPMLHGIRAKRGLIC